MKKEEYFKYVFVNDVFGFPEKDIQNYTGLEIDATYSTAGGIVGYSKAAIKITAVKTSGGIINSNGGRAGGLVGYAGEAVISKSSNGQNVTATNYAGGIISEASSNVYIVSVNDIEQLKNI